MNWLNRIVQFLGRLKWWWLVDPWEQGLRIRAGKHVMRFKPGFHFCIPFVDRVHIQSTRIRSENLPPQTITTDGGSRAITVSAVLLWRISDIEIVYRSVDSPNGYLCNLVLATIGRELAKNSKLSHDDLAAAVEGTLGQVSEFGLAVISVALSDHVNVRTMRIITGEGSGWHHAIDLDPMEKK